MDGVREFLESLRQHDLVKGHFLAVLHIVIGRKITRTRDGAVLSTGVTWRELSNLLKQMRWDPELVRELGIDPETLPPRDRQRYWYSAISQAGVDSKAARKAGDELAKRVKKLGFEVGPAPGAK
ncbi:MAG TPA: hypothetical protein VIL46_03550 [Gemmataceae bacterium]